MMGIESPAPSEQERQMLRHTLATLAYRGGKTLRGAPEGFSGFRASASTRTPGQVLAHIGDLLDWALSIAQGKHLPDAVVGIGFTKVLCRACGIGCVPGFGRTARGPGGKTLSGPDRRCSDARGPNRHSAQDGRRSCPRRKLFSRGNCCRPGWARSGRAETRIRLTKKFIGHARDSQLHP